MAVVTTSIVVEFKKADGSSGILTMEVDSRETGLNKGKTSFAPGDTAGLLLFHSPDVIIDTTACSGGSLSAIGSGVYDMDEWIVFAGTDTASLSKPSNGIVSVEWYGTSLGTTKVDGTNLVAATKGLAVARVTYGAPYTAYNLASPAKMTGKDEFQIVVFVAGHN